MDNVVNNRKQKHLNEIERGQISILTAQGLSAYRIAKLMNRAENTIRNELKRGTTTQIYKGYIEKKVYFPERGQAIYERNREKARNRRKLENKRYEPFLKYVEETFFNKKWSIDAICAIAVKNKLFPRNEVLCTGTIYTYIDKGYMNIKNIDLPCKVTRRQVKNATPRRHKRLYGESIEKRQKRINLRRQFGHWEIDTVIGKNGKNESALLVLTERKTRHEIIKKLKAKTCSEVMSAMNDIITEYGEAFSRIFLSITSDNGPEFSKLSSLEQLTGTKIYYAHPYSAFERGSNERNNGLIRRFLKKGMSINPVKKERLEQLQSWINGMPRRILGYYSSGYLFEKEIKKRASAEALCPLSAVHPLA